MKEAEAWLKASLVERFGSAGAARAGDLRRAPGASPFRRLGELVTLLETK